MRKLFLVIMAFMMSSLCSASPLELEDAKTSFEKSDSWIDISSQISVKEGIKEYGYQINDEDILLISVHESADKKFNNIIQVPDMQDFAKHYAENMKKGGNGAINIIDFGSKKLGNTEWILTNYTITQNNEIIYVRGFSTVNHWKEITFSFHYPSKIAFERNEENDLRIMNTVVTRQEPNKEDTEKHTDLTTKAKIYENYLLYAIILISAIVLFIRQHKKK